MWKQINQYCLSNGSSTITKIMLGGKVDYQLWYQGRQIVGFKSADEAKIKFDELVANSNEIV